MKSSTAVRCRLCFQHDQEPEGSFAETASHTVAGEVSTNQGAARGQLYLILFDQLHIAPGNEQRARLAAQKFVTTRLRPGDRVALYALPGPGPQIAFTPDTRRVAAALAGIHGTAEPRGFGALGSMTRYEAFEIIRGNELILQRVAARYRSQAGSDAQTRGASALSTGTLPLTELVKEDARKIANTADGESRAVLARVSDMLAAASRDRRPQNDSVHFRGLSRRPVGARDRGVAAAAAESCSVVHAFDINRREVDITADEPVGADQANNIHDKLSPLGTLAAETGGSLVLDVAARADQAFASIADQSQDYYLIGFMPKVHGQPGEYRRVSVRVKRAGARVSSRTGFALSGRCRTIWIARRTLQRAMAAPFVAAGPAGSVHDLHASRQHAGNPELLY